MASRPFLVPVVTAALLAASGSPSTAQGTQKAPSVSPAANSRSKSPKEPDCRQFQKRLRASLSKARTEPISVKWQEAESSESDSEASNGFDFTASDESAGSLTCDSKTNAVDQFVVDYRLNRWKKASIQGKLTDAKAVTGDEWNVAIRMALDSRMSRKSAERAHELELRRRLLGRSFSSGLRNPYEKTYVRMGPYVIESGTTEQSLSARIAVRRSPQDREEKP